MRSFAGSTATRDLELCSSAGIGDHMNKHKPHYASVYIPTIAEVVNGHAIATERAHLVSKLERLGKTFTTARGDRFDGEETLGDLTLWVLGFSVDQGDAKKGRVGNYMTCFIEKAASLWRIRVEKVDRDGHPRRDNPGQYHPNGSPLTIRLAKSNKPLASKEEAVGLLDDLQLKYPGPSIRPTPRKLYIIMWDPKNAHVGESTRPVVIRVRYAKEGHWYLDLEDNRFTQVKRATPDQRATRSADNDRFDRNLENFGLTLQELLSDA